MKRTTEYFTAAAAFLIMGIAVFTYAGPHFGWQVNAVLSGSMEPALKTGSLIVSSPVKPGGINVGDIVTFNSRQVSSGTVTHRVNAIVREFPYVYEMKGDANETTDVLVVSTNDIVGRVVVHIPYLGTVTQQMKTTAGFVLMIIVPAAFLFALYIWNVVNEISRMKNRKQPEAIER